MAPRARKYTSAAPAEVREQAKERAEREANPGPAAPERHEWRMSLLRRAGRGMCQSEDRSWIPVANWLCKAIVSGEQAWYFSDRVESAVLPGGEHDHACRVAQAYLNRHGAGDPAFSRADNCPEPLREPEDRKFEEKG